MDPPLLSEILVMFLSGVSLVKRAAGRPGTRSTGRQGWMGVVLGSALKC